MNRAFVTSLILVLALAGPRARGQLTESPDTVAPGRFLVEMDVLALTIDRDGPVRSTGLGVASTLFTTGLTANWDLQLGAEFYLTQKYEEPGYTVRNHGIGDVYVRAKWRLFSDPEKGTAVAVIPFVKIPTNSGGVGNRAVEGGLIVPWTARLPGEFTAAAMVELDVLRNGNDDGYGSQWYVSAALSRPLTKVVGVYAEVAAGKSPGQSVWAGTVGGGVTLAVTEEISWDLAVYHGVSRGAPDWNPVLRFNWGF